MPVLTPEVMPSLISSVEYNRPLLMPCSFHCRSPFATSTDGEIEHSTGLPSTAASSSARRYRQTRRLHPERVSIDLALPRPQQESSSFHSQMLSSFIRCEPFGRSLRADRPRMLFRAIG